MNEKRGGLHLLTGLVIGALIGLVIAIRFVPVHYIDTDPAALQGTDRALYRGLIAQAYLVEADRERAVARLGLLNDVNAVDALVAQAQQELNSGGDEAQSAALALLADAISQPDLEITPLPRVIIAATATPQPTLLSTPLALSIATSSAAKDAAGLTPKVTFTQGSSSTPAATSTPQPTQGPPFELAEQKEVCDPLAPAALIKLFVYTADQQPAVGMRIEISVAGGGSESFYTGFYPEISPGYADYAMTAGMTYNLRVGQNGQVIGNLAIPSCKDENGASYAGSLQLTFIQGK